MAEDEAGESATGAPLAGRLFVSSLEKAMRVLAAFGEERPEMALRDLSEAAGLDKSATQRFAATFHQLGYLEKDRVTRRFRPSVRFMELANAYLWADPMVRSAMPRLIDLHQSLGETVNLARLDGQDIVYLVRLPSARTSFPAMIPGRRVPALNTASGCVMLGCRAPGERASAVASWRVRRFTSLTLMDRALLAERVERASRERVAVTVNQLMLNEVSAAVPLQAPDGGLYAVHCSLSGTLWTEERARAEIIPHLQDVANALA
ncbi:IclR family transcriptional regulator [Aureimonas populi]|uniref:IclR family transcriptional regulator n=1 Tax=Aureimonas populi TaxID=1701758 RepID=A0ABW5CM35_9HYPH|nr:IclR family transcriptional regulator [Aureimonas populi]